MLETKQDIRIEVRSDPKLLKSVRRLVRSYMETCGFAEDRIDEVVLAIDEACTNAIRHSYGLDDNRQYSLIFRSGAGCVEVVLSDDGDPAPADRVKRKEAAAPDKETITPGGLGVQLIYDVFDEAEFHSGEEHGNIVTMRLRLPA